MNPQICKSCVMDTTAKNLKFDESGVCNDCKEYRRTTSRMNMQKKYLVRIIRGIKKAGKKKKYDFILGISGGVDSSYTAYLAHSFGLRGLLVHIDNGWNTPESENNVQKLVEYTGFDLHRITLDWEAFRDLHLAYLKASVRDIEVPTDHIITSLIIKVAYNKGIRQLLSGTNYATEALFPNTWLYNKMDLTNLKNIHKIFGTVPLKRLSTLGVWKHIFYTKFWRLKSIKLLDYINYNPFEAIEELKNIGWVVYGRKHEESFFTRFFANYIWPIKFGIDSRKSYLSNLIRSGFITREDAINELKSPAYTPERFNSDYKILLERMRLTELEFKKLMNLPVVDHKKYGTDKYHRMAVKMGLYPLSIVKRSLVKLKNVVKRI